MHWDRDLMQEQAREWPLGHAIVSRLLAVIVKKRFNENWTNPQWERLRFYLNCYTAGSGGKRGIESPYVPTSLDSIASRLIRETPSQFLPGELRNGVVGIHIAPKSAAKPGKGIAASNYLEKTELNERAVCPIVYSALTHHLATTHWDCNVVEESFAAEAAAIWECARDILRYALQPHPKNVKRCMFAGLAFDDPAAVEVRRVLASNSPGAQCAVCRAAPELHLTARYFAAYLLTRYVSGCPRNWPHLMLCEYHECKAPVFIWPQEQRSVDVQGHEIGTEIDGSTRISDDYSRAGTPPPTCSECSHARQTIRAMRNRKRKPYGI